MCVMGVVCSGCVCMCVYVGVVYYIMDAWIEKQCMYVRDYIYIL